MSPHRLLLLLGAVAVSLTLGDHVTIAGHSYDVAQLRLDTPRVVVTELRDFSATLFNFSLYHHDGLRRRPLVGLKKGDLTIRFADENRELDAAESSYAVSMVEGRVEPVPLTWEDQAQRLRPTVPVSSLDDQAQRFRPSVLRYVAVVVDMSESMFEATGRLPRTRAVLQSLFGTLAQANLPGVVVGAYAFADLESLQVLVDYTPTVADVQAAVNRELTLDRDARLRKYGRATDLYGSVFAALEAVEATLGASPARTALANVFFVTDGFDEARVMTADEFNRRLSRTYQAWAQAGRDVVTQPVLLGGRAALEKAQFNAEPIDGTAATEATRAFERIVADIAQNTPASYSVVVCESARDSAPRQRRDLLLQGHRLLSYDFSPAGFRREGAAKCDPAALLRQLTEQVPANTPLGDLSAEL